MCKKTIRNLSMVVLIIFIAVSAALINSESAFASASSTYKVQITASRLNIRQYPSLTSKILGSYYKGNIVDVYGQAGNFLRTSRGYIYSSYVKRYEAPAPTNSSAGTSLSPVSFQSYKVTIVNTGALRIRQEASLTSRIVGYYYRNDIVDVYGQSGNFLKTSKGYIYSSYTKRYAAPATSGSTPSSSSTSTEPSPVSFQSYKVIIVNTGALRIRQEASLTSRIVGYYYRNNIVDVYGQSGNFLKTSKGYIYSSYTQKYATPEPSRGQVTPQPYKVIVTASILNIRESDSLSSKVLGIYHRGDIVDALGQVGDFVKIPEGYLWAAYTQKYNPSQPAADNTGKYIKMNTSVPILLQIGGTADERYAVSGKVFKILSEKDGYYMIKMGKVEGYIPQSSGTVLSSVPAQKLTMAWDYVYSAATNKLHYEDSSNLINKNSAASGLDVLSPTWFYLTGDYSNKSSINVADKGDRQYVETAHKNGYEVWPLISEFDASRAYQIFNDSTTKTRVINEIANYALKYDVDGINIDFEALGSQNKAGFTAFVRDLSQKLKEMGLTVSVDVTVPVAGSSSVWSAGYDRAALASYADYIMVMAYDEHYAGSDTAGSVASEPWVENGIKTMLSEGVPNDKLVLGVPFYLRDFEVKEINLPYNSIVFNTTQSGLYSNPSQSSVYKLKSSNIGDSYKYVSQVQGYYVVQYNNGQAYIPMTSADFVSANTVKDYVVSSEVISLASALSRISANNGSTYYDINSRQDVGVYNKDGYKHLVWLENAESMSWRMKLVNQYNLPGMSAWSLNWIMPNDVWTAIKQILNK